MTTQIAVVQGATAYPLAAFGRIEQVWDNVIGLPDVTDNDLYLPGSTDAVFVPRTARGRGITVGLVVVAESEAALNDSLEQLAGLVWDPDAPILLRRTIPTGSGDQVSEAYATYLRGLNPGEKPAPHMARLALEFKLLSAYWYDATTELPVAL